MKHSIHQKKRRRKKRKGKLTEAALIAKDKARWYHIKRKYGITKEQWYEIYNAQNGCCYICQRHEKKIRASKSKYLTVDHCHYTGRIRGLLCVNCNGNILPAISENPDIALRIFMYLSKKQDWGITPDHRKEIKDNGP